ncbi:hypothetical protein EYZ11_004266 [Aspergillus tanneri]|uniref:DNA2/NAM7 helicase-like C-terminal domain-containing protein n=1 Tax=Aspergillus tanneri TaxID=1220188 RepID=A0A4S3JLD2_9EURO|nr:hypothetical protein EYZ11_004266 [Aspergillus tanneri]
MASVLKPSQDPNIAGFIGDMNRFNAVLSRAQKFLVILGNLDAWNRRAVDDLHKRAGMRNGFLIQLLRDVTDRGHTLTWAGVRTVAEREPPGNILYFAHDRSIPPSGRS